MDPSRNSSLPSLRPICLPVPRPTFSVRPRSVSSRSRSRAIRDPERFNQHIIDLPLAASRLRQKETSSRNVPTTSSFHSSGNSTPTNSTLNVIAQQAANPAPAYKTLEEIEAEARAAYARPNSGFTASALDQGSYGMQAPPSAGQPGDRPMTLEEIEREMMSNLIKSASPAPVPATSARQIQQPQNEMPSGLPQGYVQHLYQGQPQAQIQSPVVPPANVQQQARPPASDLTGIELLQKQLGNLAMFPPLGSAAPAKGQPKSEEQMDRELEARIRETEMAEMKRMRKANKIASMSRYNDVMTGGANLAVLLRVIKYVANQVEHFRRRQGIHHPNSAVAARHPRPVHIRFLRPSPQRHHSSPSRCRRPTCRTRTCGRPDRLASRTRWTRLGCWCRQKHWWTQETEGDCDAEDDGAGQEDRRERSEACYGRSFWLVSSLGILSKCR
jgi:hypothetical protein